MTIKDIAKIAGVAHSTVSRCLNDSPLVSDETKRKIRAIAEAHGYSPNSLARNLVTRKSNTLGLFFLSREELNFMENFGTQFMSAITSACHRHGYDLLLFTTPRDLGNTKSYMELCRQRQVEGVIFMGMTFNDPHLEEIRTSDIPAIIIDFQLDGPNVASIGTDSEQGIHMALEWLWSMGHEHIAFIGGPEVSQVAVDRERAYREFMATRAGPEGTQVFRGNFSRVSGYQRGIDILKENPVPTAILAANDAMALGAMKAFKEHGLRVPVDISVMGYDDAAASEFSDPGLSTIGQNSVTIGEGAVDYIIERIAGKRPQKIILVEPQLVIRESVRRIPR